ncbi:MAG: D-alanyl-D-alanine carboxypeptidase/D-alanyl-D-alanine-endopeptidase, partial [Candidatus Marinimicrobia bacterium]|nr:D-alanyl-D-alanine carboxypeptidase/D-alanyl-D-alanine-endopeptidase [Candidatus Neomarinimicrobiota bacterium]
KVFLNGNIKRGKLQGNLLIKGSGDPTLASEYFVSAQHRLAEGSIEADEFYNQIILALKDKGIREIHGHIIIDNSLFSTRSIPDFWIWGDIGNYYGAGLQSFCFSNNLYYLTFQPGKNIGDPAKILRTEPELHDFTFMNEMKTGPIGSGDRGYIYSAPGMNYAIARGTIPAGVDEFTIKGSISNPPLNTAKELAKRLKNADIKIKGQATVENNPENIDYSEYTETSKFTSPELREIIKVTNRKSVNLFAEQIMQSAVYYTDGKRQYDDAITGISDMLDSLKVDRSGFNIVDGSGLSRTNNVSTHVFSDFLAAMSREACFDDYYQSFSIAGDKTAKGHISRFCKDQSAADNARVKSGYIQNVRSHSGYVTAANGRLIAFSCIANNYSGKTSKINNLHEQICNMLANER